MKEEVNTWTTRAKLKDYLEHQADILMECFGQRRSAGLSEVIGKVNEYWPEHARELGGEQGAKMGWLRHFVRVQERALTVHAGMSIPKDEITPTLFVDCAMWAAEETLRQREEFADAYEELGQCFRL